MDGIPREHAFDSTLALLREGYRFVGARCRRHDSDLFRARLLLRPVVCMTGKEAAALLYDGERFTRRGAVPKRVQKLLQDEGSVQSLDDAAHRHRKALFMGLMRDAEIARLADLMEEHWQRALTRWRQSERIVLHQEIRRILTAAGCDWVGVPMTEKTPEQASRELGAMIDGTGAFGPRYWTARALRARNERWIREVIDAVRAGGVEAPAGAPLRTIVDHRDPDGKPLDRAVAAVEVINLLRPIVAVGRFVTFAAHALQEHQATAEGLRDGSDSQVEAFVQEVRRFYPFFPLIGGIARRDFEWRSHRFARGDWALLDLYGTDHDPRIWEEPEQFRPERFIERPIGADELIPQGAGDPYRGHRCPGEWVTVALMKRAVRLLLALDYRLPAQDLSIDLGKVPALPRSGFIMQDIRPRTV